MNENADLKQLTDLWHYLTPAQRKIIALRARLHLAEIAFYWLVILLFLFIARMMVPVPKKIYAHYL